MVHSVALARLGMASAAAMPALAAVNAFRRVSEVFSLVPLTSEFVSNFMRVQSFPIATCQSISGRRLGAGRARKRLEEFADAITSTAWLIQLVSRRLSARCAADALSDAAVPAAPFLRAPRHSGVLAR